MDYVAVVAKVARLRQTGWAAWGIVFFLFALTLSVRLFFSPHLHATPFAVFLPAAPIATLACGWRRSVPLLAASAVVSWFILDTKPEGALTPPFDVRVIAFLLLGGFMIALTEGLAQALQRLDSVAQLNAELFRELQHRVANNFQIVAATLQKARRGLADKAGGEAIDEAILRIDALGRLHRRLYDPESYKDGLEPILREVLGETFQGVSAEIRIDIRAQSLSVGQLTTIVLLVNEAAINAAKHVFAQQRGEQFSVALQAAGRAYVLTVSDDGPGFKTAEDRPTSRYGLAVMRGLAAQLGGTLEILDASGAVIRVAFEG